MDPDNLQAAWQSPASHGRLTIDAEVLLKEVQRNQRLLWAVVFWRDVREIGVALVLAGAWIYMGLTMNLPWTWYLMVPALIGIAGFLLVDRLRHRREAPAADQPLVQHVEFSLAQVEHQIWLLKNIFWWYILPFLAPIFAFLLHLTWLGRGRGFEALHMVVLVAVLVLATVSFIYWLNQSYVRTNLAPRRQELEALLASLEDAA